MGGGKARRCSKAAAPSLSSLQPKKPHTLRDHISEAFPKYTAPHIPERPLSPQHSPFQWMWLQLPTGDPQILTPVSPMPCQSFIEPGKKGVYSKQSSQTMSTFLDVYPLKPSLFNTLIEVIIWGTKPDVEYF